MAVLSLISVVLVAAVLFAFCVAVFDRPARRGRHRVTRRTSP